MEPAYNAVVNRLCVIAAFGALSAVSMASERAIVTMQCPLDGTEFQAVQEFSGFPAGQRLDLKKLGAISQPRPLARCPECSLPIWDKYPDEELKARLRAALQSERYRTEGRDARPWFALGVLREELADEAFAVAWTYLQASWEAEENEQPERYAEAARRALGWFDRAAAGLAGDPERRADYHTALYLPIELARRTGDFADAQRRLDAWPEAASAQDPWLRAAIASQRQLVAAGRREADDRIPDSILRGGP
jgi:hypothetical protein